MPDMKKYDLILDALQQLLEEKKIQNISVDVKDEVKAKKIKKPDELELAQMSLFDTVTDEDVVKELMELEVNSMSPLDALNTLYRLQNKLKNRWQG